MLYNNAEIKLKENHTLMSIVTQPMSSLNFVILTQQLTTRIQTDEQLQSVSWLCNYLCVYHAPVTGNLNNYHALQALNKQKK